MRDEQFKVVWKDAISEAKEELGYDEDEYLSREYWDEVVDTAKSILKRDREEDFNYRKKKLREYFKLLKARLIEWEKIPEDYQKLLIKYYGVKEAK